MHAFGLRFRQQADRVDRALFALGQEEQALREEATRLEGLAKQEDEGQETALRHELGRIQAECRPDYHWLAALFIWLVLKNI